MTNEELRQSLARHDWEILNLRFILIPVQVSYFRWTFHDSRQVEYRSLYIFGLRIARWRA